MRSAGRIVISILLKQCVGKNKKTDHKKCNGEYQIAVCFFLHGQINCFMIAMTSALANELAKALFFFLIKIETNHADASG